MRSEYPKLNLPPVELNVKVENGKAKVFDPLRRKFVAFTPEEYVRQHFVAYLADGLHYPRGLMGNEVSLDINGLWRRCDTLVSDREGKPLMVVEYKAPGVTITQDVFDQIARYNMVIGARYVVVSNGLRHFCCMMDSSGSSYQFIPRIPDHNESLFGSNIN